MYRPHSSSQSFFINQAISAGYLVPPASYTDEELGIPQQRFPSYREMRETIMIEIEKEKRRYREIQRMQRELLSPGSEFRLIGASISPPIPQLFMLPQDGGMSLEEKLARNCEEKRLEEKLARNCEEKRLAEKAAAVRRQLMTARLLH